jgi:hypothetical protein
MFPVSLQSLRQRQLPPPPLPPPNFSHISPRIKPDSESLTQIPYFGLCSAFKQNQKNTTFRKPASVRPQANKRLSWWTHWIELYSVTGRLTGSRKNKQNVAVSHTASSKLYSVQVSSGCTSLYKQKIYNYIRNIKNFLFIKSCTA